MDKELATLKKNGDSTCEQIKTMQDYLDADKDRAAVLTFYMTCTPTVNWTCVA